jgi:hypothetical protein
MTTPFLVSHVLAESLSAPGGITSLTVHLRKDKITGPAALGHAAMARVRANTKFYPQMWVACITPPTA